MRFAVLGPLEVVTADGAPVRVPEAKVRALLVHLLVQDGAPVSVDRLAQDLWGDRQPRNPTAALQRKVWQLRRALEDAEPGSRDLIVHSAAGYALRADTVDSARFAALVSRARAADDLHLRVSLLDEALCLWRGPALADVRDEEFSRAAVARLEEQRLTAVEDHTQARLELGEPVADELGALVAEHPLRERLRAVHLRALYRAGRPSEALAGYHDLRVRLADSLGLDPGQELVALHQAILEQDPVLAGPTAGNLPNLLTPLIGRSAEVGEVRARLADRRLVTLTGPGGVGKTRLALAAAGTGAFADGVWLVELAGPGTPEDAVAGVLGVRDDTGFGAPVPLAEALCGKNLLLVLDNCEQVIEQAAELAVRLLLAAPGLRVLATSREPLGLAGESLFEVPPLEMAEAVALFTARATDAAFALTAADAPAVETLCRRLDGIPLALELAATRVRALGVAGLVARLDDRFRLLATGHRGSPPRQQTLRAVIDWSWDLLSDAERVALRRLAVHADGCTLEAAEAVGGDPDVVARLVSRSLVVAVPGPRFRLLESVASYGVERLREAGEYAEVRRRHLEYYVGLAERAELRGPAQLTWLRRLDAESANFRAALDTAVGLGDFRLVNALGWYWILRGRLQEGRRAALSFGGADPVLRTWQSVMAALLDADSSTVDLSEIADEGDRARAAWLLGFSLLGCGDVTTASNLIDTAMAGFEAVGDRWGLAAALAARGDLAVARGDLAVMSRDGSRSLALFRELGDWWGQLRAIEVLSALAEITGSYSEAADLRREGLTIAEDLELWSEVSHFLSGLGRLALLSGDYAEAEHLHQRARHLAIEQSTKAGQYFAELGLAMGARRTGDLDKAARYLTPWLAWCDEVDWQPGKALVLAELGFGSEQRGDADTALAQHLTGLAVARETGDPRAIALALEGVAGAQALHGRHELAARLLGAATATRAAAGAPLPPPERTDINRITATLRTALGSPTLDAEFATGQTWNLTDCLDELTPTTAHDDHSPRTR